MKQTSIEAFKDVRTQDRIESEVNQIYAVFVLYPKIGLTAHDIADLSGLNYYIVQKRKSILERKHLIKACGTRRVNGYNRTMYKKT
ncbi:hypothetical protein FGF1_03770 [Flavobacteriaceae bacterium GF1]